MSRQHIPHLPVQPLLPVLRRAVSVQALGNGGFRSGLERIVVAMGYSGKDGRSNERLIRRILHGEVSSIREPTADRIAAALGMHPTEIWVDWYELTNVRVRG
jgi:hypothetical protein